MDVNDLRPPLLSSGPLPPALARLRPGNVIVVRQNTIFAKLIRFGAHLAGLSADDNHVIVYSNVDPRGVPMGIEGRPGGVGYVDLRPFFTGPLANYTHTNWRQPINPAQRGSIATFLKASLGTRYDWFAIAGDAIDDVARRDVFVTFMDDLWQTNGTRPESVVCSSLASYAYYYNGLAHPDKDNRHTQPADWQAFIKQNHFE